LSGKKVLKGSIDVGGAKNSALKAIAGSILFDGPVVLRNIPRNRDVDTLTEILSKLGAKVAWKEGQESALEIDTRGINSTDIDPELAVSMRASVVLTGPMLARFGRVTFPAPGGCVIGARPIDLFISGYQKLGATINLQNGLYVIEAPNGLSGGEIFFPIQSVGGTETLMMASVMAKGRVTLKNCAMEPEIVNVAEWLIANGAKIYDVGTTTIEIEGNGGKLLSSEGLKDYTAIPDRIEAGSYVILSALCGDDVTINNCNPDHLESLINLLLESGVNIEVKKGVQDGSIRVFDNEKRKYKAINIRTHEYPGFPTDLQSPIVTYLSQVEGESIIFETIYEGRFKFIEELQKMGGDITVMNPREILVRGPKELKSIGGGANLYAHDIRGGFAVVIATICGTGVFTIDNIQLIDRGYAGFVEKLAVIGVDIKRISNI
jgi:UDP-N-acetylglucosamine 1-carboxyvinyltransferase